MQNWQKHSGIVNGGLCKCILSTSICLWWWALWCIFTIPGYCLPLCRDSKREVCLIRAVGVGGFPCTPSLSLSSTLLRSMSSCSFLWFTFKCLVRFVVLPQYRMHFEHKSQVASFAFTAVKCVHTMLLFLSAMLSFSFSVVSDWLSDRRLLACVHATRISAKSSSISDTNIDHRFHFLLL